MNVATQSPATSSLSRSLPPSHSSPLLESTSRTFRTPTPRRGNHFLPSNTIYNSTTFSSRPHQRQYSHSQTMPCLTSFLAPRRASHNNNHPESFEPETIQWLVTDVNALAKHVEGIKQGGGLWQIEGEMDNPESLPDALSRGWESNKRLYRVDLARTIPAPFRPTDQLADVVQAFKEEHDSEVFPPTLTLYITALGYDGQPLDETFNAGVFVGITSAKPNVGQDYAQTKYLWSSKEETMFSDDNDFFGVTLPLLSDLYEYPEIKQHDAFTLCIYIGPRWEVKPEFKVPDPMLSRKINGMRRLLDRDTGDVKFICLEHTTESNQESEDSSTERRVSQGLQSRSEDAGGAGKRFTTLSRKRVIFGHSDILEETSDYFRDMLNGGFSESKRYTTVYVETESFGTLYWILRFLYTDEMIFDDNEDVREIMDRMRLDPSEVNKLLRGGPGGGAYLGAAEWAFHRLPLEGEVDSTSVQGDTDVKTAPSVSSAGTGAGGGPQRKLSENHGKGAGVAAKPMSAPRPRAESAAKSPATTSPSIASQSPTARTTQTGSGPSESSPGTHDILLNSQQAPITPFTGRPPSSTASTRTVRSPTTLPRASGSKAQSDLGSRRVASPSSKTAGQPVVTPPKSKTQTPTQRAFLANRLQPEADPHVHPTVEPPPASALEVYMLAHRYRLEQLKELAKKHILQKLTSDNCVAMGFATYHYDELHEEVIDFIAIHWPDVKTSTTFLQCIKEVREDVWGENGPMVLHNIFKRL